MTYTGESAAAGAMNLAPRLLWFRFDLRCTNTSALGAAWSPVHPGWCQQQWCRMSHLHPFSPTDRGSPSCLWANTLARVKKDKHA